MDRMGVGEARKEYSKWNFGRGTVGKSPECLLL